MVILGILGLKGRLAPWVPSLDRMAFQVPLDQSERRATQVQKAPWESMALAFWAWLVLLGQKVPLAQLESMAPMAIEAFGALLAPLGISPKKLESGRRVWTATMAS